MKKTNQKSKPGILGIWGSVLIGSFACATTASAQTSSGVQHPDTVQSSQQISQQQIVMEKPSTMQQVRPVPAENKVPSIVGGQPGTAPHGVPASSGAATSKQNATPASIEQLKYQRRQAAQRGQSTAEFDKAIEEQTRNQAN